MRYSLFTFLILLSSSLCLQAQSWGEHNQSYKYGEYAITIRAVEDDSEINKQFLDYYQSVTDWKYPLHRVITNPDSIIQIVRDAGYMITEEYPMAYTIGIVTNQNEYLSAFKSLVFPVSYFPDDKILVARAQNDEIHTLNLATGKNQSLIEYTDTISQDLRILGTRYHGSDSEDGDLCLLIEHKKRDGNWEELVNLTEIMEEPSRRDFYKAINGKLYILSLDCIWEIDFKKVESKTNKKHTYPESMRMLFRN